MSFTLHQLIHPSTTNLNTMVVSYHNASNKQKKKKKKHTQLQTLKTIVATCKQ